MDHVNLAVMSFKTAAIVILIAVAAIVLAPAKTIIVNGPLFEITE